MRFAVISDVHGNVDALRAVLDDMEKLKVPEFINLGDHLSGPLSAAETADLLMSCAMPSIRGNCDRELVETPRGQLELSDSQALAQLSKRHLDWLRAQPATRVFRDDVLMCHGTPNTDMDYWLDQVQPGGHVTIAALEMIRAKVAGLPQSLMLCGHSHLPRAVQVPDGPLIVNPGSVGLPAYEAGSYVIITGSPHARYAIIERSERQWDVTFRLVPYDTAKMAALAEERGRPEWARAIRTGWI